jgi:hypothetical protein
MKYKVNLATSPSSGNNEKYDKGEGNVNFKNGKTRLLVEITTKL